MEIDVAMGFWRLVFRGMSCLEACQPQILLPDIEGYIFPKDILRDVHLSDYACYFCQIVISDFASNE
jgi:hypothetical protein